MVIIGFDVSSTTIGYCVLDIGEDIKYIASGFIKPCKKGDLFSRLYKTKREINELLYKYTPEHVVIEEISKFFPNKSKAQTIIMLAVFNRMVGLESYAFLNKEPLLLPVMSIRSTIRKEAKLATMPDKKELPEIIAKLLNIEFPWVTKKNKRLEESYDVSDGICCAFAGAHYISGKYIKKAKVKKRIKKK
jgi:Holliday junction resolvasome RuvABC endonuclease subunit